MIFALAVAVLLGGALGWILHRTSHTGQIQTLKNTLARQHKQLVQSQTDVSMLTDDYDELHRKTQEEIDVLRVDNRQIPQLTSNLEKSQLLVRQMMQKHEAKVHELTTKNNTLHSKLTKFDEQEQIKNKLAAELDAKRRDKANRDSAAAPLYVSAESDNDPFDQVIEISDDMQGEITADSKNDIGQDEQLLDTDQVIELNADMQDDVSTPLSEDVEPLEQPSSSDLTIDTSDILSGADGLSFDSELEQSADVSDSDTEQLNFQLSEIDDSTDTAVSEDEADIDPTNSDAHLDGSADPSMLFEPVNQKDDLKQIFGIGPLTEQALYELGITSYSQLADLEKHDIQRIADALEIVPARIERDNWVGNARRQLEEVLDQL